LRAARLALVSYSSHRSTGEPADDAVEAHHPTTHDTAMKSTPNIRLNPLLKLSLRIYASKSIER
jgi:hypothetical protein